MRIQTNIRGIIQNNSKFLAGVIVGGMIAAASILPWGASAESPAKPAADVGAASSISSQGQHFLEVDHWVSLTYSEKLVPANAPSAMDSTEVDDWATLTYSEKLVPANAPSAMNSTEVDDWVTLTYSEKLVPTNAPSATDYTEVDDWVTLTYDE